VEIHLCCLHGFVPRLEGHHGAVNSMLQKVHGGAVPKGVRRDLLPFERRASLFGNIVNSLTRQDSRIRSWLTFTMPNNSS
jgi:hypothetical protein